MDAVSSLWSFEPLFSIRPSCCNSLKLNKLCYQHDKLRCLFLAFTWVWLTCRLNLREKFCSSDFSRHVWNLAGRRLTTQLRAKCRTRQRPEAEIPSDWSVLVEWAWRCGVDTGDCWLVAHVDRRRWLVGSIWQITSSRHWRTTLWRTQGRYGITWWYFKDTSAHWRHVTHQPPIGHVSYLTLGKQRTTKSWLLHIVLSSVSLARD